MRNPAAKPNRQADWAAAVCCAIAGFVLFQWFGSAAQGYVKTDSLFWWWISQWIDPNAETQHGWLVLAIAAWLLWRNVRGQSLELRAQSLEQEPNGLALSSRLSALDWPAVAAILAALALHAVGFVAQQARVSIVALLLFTRGVLRLGGGRRWGAAAAFPLAFLVFAIPLNALDTVGFWLRVWVIRASTAIAHGAGIGILQNGTQLVSPDGRYNYDVAAACSGIRSLMALAALSLLLGYLNFRSWWRRGLMLLLCFPLVYVGNVARIAAIVFAAQAGGTRWGDIAHEVMGYAIFVIVLGGVLGAARLLERWWPESVGRGFRSAPSEAASAVRQAQARRDAALPAVEGGPPSPCGIGHEVGRTVPGEPVRTFTARRDASPYLAAVFVALFAAGEALFLHHVATLPPRGLVGVALAAGGRDPVELPAILDRDWVGTSVPVSEVERAVLPADTGYSKIRYASTHGAPAVFVSIVLSGRDRTSIHRPELCLVGQGWTIAGAAEHRFAYPGSDEQFPATLLRVRREVKTAGGTAAVPQLVAYWFVTGDAVVATHWRRMELDAWNRVVHGRADRWAYVLMQTDAVDGESAAIERMQQVLDRTLPTFQRVR